MIFNIIGILPNFFELVEEKKCNLYNACYNNLFNFIIVTILSNAFLLSEAMHLIKIFYCCVYSCANLHAYG